MHRRRWLVLGCVAALTACAGVGGPTVDVPAAEVADGADCLADDVVRGLLGAVPRDAEPRPAPAAGRVPDGFAPVHVVECRTEPLRISTAPPPVLVPDPPGGEVDLHDLEEADVPAGAGPGTPDVLRMRELVREGDLGRLLRALARPSQAPRPDQVCTADMVVVPQVYLVDADGRAVRAAWPHDARGKPLHGVTESLATVPVVGEREVTRAVG